jgi:chloramphenicol 3-O-phosphotransferase
MRGACRLVSTEQGAIDAHRQTVRVFAKPGGPLAADGPNASVNNPRWFTSIMGDRRPSNERRELHQRLIQDHADQYPQAQAQKRAIVLAGPPGAGKSHTLGQLLGEDKAHFLLIDADDFKKALLEAALEDGSYVQYLVPDAVHTLQKQGEQFFPLELASLVHEESSMLAKRASTKAIADGFNVVIDTVLSSASVALKLGNQLQAAGYSVEIIDVEVPYELSQRRIASRWQESYVQALEKDTGLGGRWVPSEYARNVFNGPGGRSLPEIAAEGLAAQCAAVKEFRRYRTTLDAQGNPVGPVLEVHRHRINPGDHLQDVLTATQAKAQAARDFAQGQVGTLRPSIRPPARTPRPTRQAPGSPDRSQGRGR